MITATTIPRRAAWIIAALLLPQGCVQTDADSRIRDVHLAWSEQVQLAEGKRIVVERMASGQTDGEIGGPGGWISSEMTLAIVATSVEAAPPPVWRGSTVPVLLDHDTQGRRWTLVATISSCPDWYALGRPAAPYVQYESRGNSQWKQVPLEARYLNQETNLLSGPRHTGEDHLVTLQEKKERLKGIEDRFVRIVPHWKTNC